MYGIKVAGTNSARFFSANLMILEGIFVICELTWLSKLKSGKKIVLKLTDLSVTLVFFMSSGMIFWDDVTIFWGENKAVEGLGLLPIVIYMVILIT